MSSRASLRRMSYALFASTAVVSCGAHNASPSSGAASSDLVDTVGNLLSWRLFGSLSGSLRGWAAQTTVNYTGAFRGPGSVPVRKVDSGTTVDVNIGYRVDGG